MEQENESNKKKIYTQEQVDAIMDDFKTNVLPQIRTAIEARQKKSTGVTLVTLAQAPTEQTTQYTVGSGQNAKTYDFKIGDEVRVADQENGEEETNGYVYYKLYDLVTENNVTTAYWELLGAGAGGGSAAAYTPTLNAAPTSSTITYTRDGKTVDFEIGQFCRVANAQSNTGYNFYQLYDIAVANAGEANETRTAVWKAETASPTYDASTHTVIFPAASGVTVDSHTVVFD